LRDFSSFVTRQWKPAPEKKDSAAAKPDAKSDSARTTKADTAKADTTPGAMREKKDLENMYANPGRLAKAGVRFALTSGGGKADIRDAVRKPIEYGLSENDALRAITASPAQILGFGSLGKVEAGLPASFTVTTKPIFHKDAKVAYTFVDGALEKTDAVKPGASPAGGRRGPGGSGHLTDNNENAGYMKNGGAR
jgi:imidazolonepropionase-like amidohydrolase